MGIKIKYKNPKKIPGSFFSKIKTNFYSNSDLKKEKGKLYLSSKEKGESSFLLWVSRIKDWKEQKVSKMEYNIDPFFTYEDKENDNIIDVFDFSDKLQGKFNFVIDFQLKRYEINTFQDDRKLKKYDKNSSLYKEYTKSEKYLEQTQKIERITEEIIKDDMNYIEKVRAIFNWVVENLSYKFPPKKRGVKTALEERQGDCGSFNSVFITLCRNVGLPARAVLGMWASSKFKKAFHAWAEFYLEDIGWIPVDCSVAESIKTKRDKKLLKFFEEIGVTLDHEYYFGNLDNKRIAFSKGNNILLKKCPKEVSQFEMMEDCRSLIMQPDSVYPYVNGEEEGIFELNFDLKLELNLKDA